MRQQSVQCQITSHLWLWLSLSALPPVRVPEGGRNAIPIPDFLLINPGEWQGWHSLILRLREAPGILVPSKHHKLPRLQFHCLLIPTHNPHYMKFTILPSTARNPETLALNLNWFIKKKKKNTLDVIQFKQQTTVKLPFESCCVGITLACIPNMVNANKTLIKFYSNNLLLRPSH